MLLPGGGRRRSCRGAHKGACGSLGLRYPANALLTVVSALVSALSIGLAECEWVVRTHIGDEELLQPLDRRLPPRLPPQPLAVRHGRIAQQPQHARRQLHARRQGRLGGDFAYGATFTVGGGGGGGGGKVECPEKVAKGLCVTGELARDLRERLGYQPLDRQPV